MTLPASVAPGAVSLASGVDLARSDLHLFRVGRDGDGFSIDRNHLNRRARKDINRQCVRI